MDFTGRSPSEALELLQCLGVLLYTGDGPHCVMLKGGRSGAELLYTLRDILHTLEAVAGMRVRVRVALVRAVPALRRAGQDLHEVLGLLGCELCSFEHEAEALAWLAPQGACHAARSAPQPVV